MNTSTAGEKATKPRRSGKVVFCAFGLLFVCFAPTAAQSALRFEYEYARLLIAVDDDDDVIADRLQDDPPENDMVKLWLAGEGDAWFEAPGELRVFQNSNAVATPLRVNLTTTLSVQDVREERGNRQLRQGLSQASLPFHALRIVGPDTPQRLMDSNQIDGTAFGPHSSTRDECARARRRSERLFSPTNPEPTRASRASGT